MLTSRVINTILGIDVSWQVHESFMKNKSEVSIHIHNGQQLNVYTNEKLTTFGLKCHEILLVASSAQYYRKKKENLILSFNVLMLGKFYYEFQKISNIDELNSICSDI